MKVTIIGAGNAGFVHAAKLIERGIEVCICKTYDVLHSVFFSKVESLHGFNVIDVTNGDRASFARPALITRDIQKAVEFADIIMVMTTTTQHRNVAQRIADYVRDGQIIALIPGYMGSLLFKQHIKKEVIYSEWETTAYNGRIVDEDHARVTFYNPHNAISCNPVNQSGYVLEKFSSLFDNTRYLRKNILESAFHNPNMIVHPIGVLFSAARIEHSEGEFWMYREAFTPSVINVIKAFDQQKNAILELFGCERLDYFDAAKWRNSEDLSLDSMEVFRSFAKASNKGPGSLKSRYFTEDVPNGLCLYSSIAKVVGLKCAIADSLIELASALLNKDLRIEARTIQSLLLSDDLKFEDICNAIESER